MRTMLHFCLRSVTLALALSLAVSDAMAAPNVSNVSLRGLQTGGTTTLVVEGSDLLPDARVVAPFPITGQRLLPGSQANRIEMEVAVDDRAVPGIYQLRIASGTGVSNPVAVGIDRLAQLP